MNKIYMVAFVALLSIGLVASAAYARGPIGKSGFMTFNSMDLVGVSVKNPQGRFLGLVNGIEVDSGGHAFAIVNHGDYDLYGSSGVNSPVPLEALKISETKAGKVNIVLNEDTEHMDFAPYLNPFKTSSRQNEANIYEYYGVQPYWTAAAACAK